MHRQRLPTKLTPLNAIRLARRKTIRALADEVGATPDHVARVARGQVVPSTRLAASLAHALGIEVGHLDFSKTPRVRALLTGSRSPARQPRTGICEVGADKRTRRRVQDGGGHG